MIKCQGENIDFCIEVINQDGSTGDVAMFAEINLEAKSGCHSVKFSTISKAGYKQLNVLDNTLIGEIGGEDTNLMLGDLKFELSTTLNVDGQPVIDTLPSENSGIKIVKK